MADLSDFHKKQAREEEIEAAIQALLKIPIEEHMAQITKMDNLLKKSTAYLEMIKAKQEDGITISPEEKQQLAICLELVNKLTDYMILLDVAISRRLLSNADKYYYHIKELSKNGNAAATKILETLTPLKQKQLEEDLDQSVN